MTMRRLLSLGLALSILTAAAAIIAWQAYHAPRGLGLLHALPELLSDVPKDEQRIGRIILDSYTEYRTNARNWSLAYFGSLFLSAVCAALAGLVIKLELWLRNESFKKDLAAFLAMVSALLITLATVGGFQRRWEVNRLAAAKMERLGYAFMTADRQASLDSFSKEIQAISYERSAEIVTGGADKTRAESMGK